MAKKVKKDLENTENTDLSPDEVRTSVENKFQQFKNRKKQILIGLLAFVIFLPLAVFFLLDNVNPDTGSIYGAKRFKEKKILETINNPVDKQKYYEQLLDRRLDELDYLVKNEVDGYMETSSSRYTSTVGEMANLIIDNNLKDRVPEVEKKFQSHKIELKELHDYYLTSRGPLQTLDLRRYLQQNMDSLDIYMQEIATKLN